MAEIAATERLVLATYHGMLFHLLAFAPLASVFSRANQDVARAEDTLQMMAHQIASPVVGGSKEQDEWTAP